MDLRRLIGRSAGPISAPALTPLSRSEVRRRVLLLAGLAAILMVLSVLIWNVRRVRSIGRAAPRIESIAVIPLANLSGEPGQEYFSDGMTDALITELAQIQELTVISRTSVMQYKAARKSTPQIAKELKVDAVVEGSVQRSGDRVAINVQLIHAPMDRHLWAKNYEGNLRDVLGLQREVARAIADEIKAKLTPEEETRLASRRPVDPVAYEAYLKGFHHARKLTKEGLDEGMEYFRQALAHDPDYAPAHYGVAFVYAWLGDWYAPNREVLPKSEAAARKAIELDPSLAEAHTVVAVMRMTLNHDWSQAEEEYHRAIQLNPGSSLAHRWFGFYLNALGRFESGLQELRRAAEIDPLSAEANHILGENFYYSRRYDEAIAQLQRTLELDPSYFWSEVRLGHAYEEKRQFREAIAAYERARDVTAQGGEVPPEILAGLARIHAAAGDQAEATKILKELESLRKRRYVAPHNFAIVYLALGRKDEALAWLEKSYEDRNWETLFIKVDPRLHSLRSHARFQAILGRMAFPD